MVANRQKRSRGGFTLMELMVTVGLIGALAAIAIPNFIAYQARSRRSEAFASLASLARAQKSYQAEMNSYVDTFDETGEPAVPNMFAYPQFGIGKMPWDADATTFSKKLGWEPEGQVHYSYDVKVGGSGGCACDLCFTATAHGDVDGDGALGAVMYVQPQIAAGTTVACKSYLGAYGPPARPKSGESVYEEVAIYGASDDY